MIAQIISAPIIFVDAEVDKCTQCETELQELQRQVDSYNGKVVRATKLFHETLVSNLKKDLTIRQLKRKLAENRSKEFTDTLSTFDELKKIAVSEKDSTFVMKAVRSVYSEDLSRLKNKKYSERQKKGKEVMSPDKREVITKLYMERIDLTEKDPTKADARKFKFAKYVKDAISNINRGSNK